LDAMQIDETAGYLAALASSRDDGRDRWSELRVYYLPRERRCWLAQSEGHSIVPGETTKRRRIASSSLDRALKLFDDSDLGVCVKESAFEYACEHQLPRFPREGAPADDRKALAALFGVKEGEMVSWKAAAAALGMGESSLRMAVKNGTDVRVPLRSIFPYLDRAAFQRDHVKEQADG
jgi:hypothetical protein